MSTKKSQSLVKRFLDNDLHAWVFVTGAIVLIIEVIAVRILAPYFGNTLFSISSVLSVVLLALSAGYWHGGKLADKMPERKLFYTIIAASGFLLLVIETIRDPLLEQASQNLSLTTGPLISSILLFIGPAFLLGMLSPLAIKIRSVEKPKIGIGTVTGSIFFWSTLGSISGSLAAGFWLIPSFGVDAIMLSQGVVLVLLGGLPLLRLKVISSRIMGGMLVLALGLGGFSAVVHSTTEPNVIFESEGIYENIQILELEKEGRLTRLLKLNSSRSGSSYVGSDDLVFNYAKYHILDRALNIDVKNAATIGGGTYTIARELINHPDQPQIDAVEIEPSLIDLAYEYFELPYSDKLTNHIEDGRRFLEDSDKKYDYLFVDVYLSLFSVPTHFTTEEFFQLSKDRLADDGIFISNTIGDVHTDDRSFLASEMKTFSSVFENSYFFNLENNTPFGINNFIFLGINGDQEINFGSLKDHPNEILANLENLMIDIDDIDFSEQIIFTDNYAPVDFLIMQMLNRHNY